MLESSQLWAVDRSPKKAVEQQGEKSDSDQRKQAPRILIVEDEFFVAWNLQSVLRDLKFKDCEIASDLESALERAIECEANLLLMDINLGEGPDGIEVVRRIQAYLKVDVIFITAYADSDTLKRIEEVAPNSPVLIKPASPAAIEAAIRQVIRN